VENNKDNVDATKDVRQILRERREMLDRVRASLNAIGDLQREFQGNTARGKSLKYPTTKLEDVCRPNVRMISISELSISVVLEDHQIISIIYPSEQALSDDLKAWSKSATPQDLKRLNLLPRGTE
jgi:hypothetical protein